MLLQHTRARTVDHSSESQHGKAAVLDLSELVPLEGLRVLAEAKGIEPGEAQRNSVPM
jgi:hypothetical protein